MSQIIAQEIDSSKIVPESGDATARVRVLAPLVVILATSKLIIHLATTGAFGYSWFVDELYYAGVYYAEGEELGLPWTYYKMLASGTIIGSGQRYLHERYHE